MTSSRKRSKVPAHTPRDWKVYERWKSNPLVIEARTGRVIAEVSASPEGHANAWLMAASPTLLEHHKTAVSLLCNFTCRHRVGSRAIHSDRCTEHTTAIAAAEGAGKEGG